MFPHRYQIAKRQLEEALHITVVEGRHALAEATWLAAHPEARASDLMEAFSDGSIQAIVSTIGGDDSIRLLPFLDLSLIRSHPKIFLGYSDSTVTHFACLKAGIVSFYGPSIMAGFGENGGLFPYMTESVMKILFSTEPPGIVQPNKDGWTSERLDWARPELQHQKRSVSSSSGWRLLQGTGIHRGKLIGGCLEVVDWLRGSSVWPDASEWRSSILFLELSEEAISPGAVLRILRSMAAAGAFQSAQALLFGRPYGTPSDFDAYDTAIVRACRELGLESLRLVTQMDFGHTDPMFVIPYGIEAEVDCDNRQFRLLSGAVS